MRYYRTGHVAIVGGGVTGLTAAFTLRRTYGVENTIVLEREERPGGNIRTERSEGFVVEHGPNGFLDNVPETLALAEELDLEVLRSNDAARRRFLASGRSLCEIPTGPLSFLTTSLLSFSGRLRVFAEPFARKKPPGDETVYHFAERRIGQEAAQVFVDTMVLGVFAGDSRCLSLASAFPRMAQLEAQYGSLVRALVALALSRKRTKGNRSGGPAGPGGTLMSFRNGLSELVEALTASLGEGLQTATGVRSVTREGTHFILHTTKGLIRAEKVLLAVPAASCAAILEDASPAAASLLRHIPTAPVAVVALAFKADQLSRALDGFGFLVPRREGVHLLGSLWTSSIFPGRVPPGYVLLRNMFGGMRDPLRLALSDRRLVELCVQELGRYLGPLPAPERTWIFRYPFGISQYVPGHSERLKAARCCLSKLGPVYLAGSSFDGISVNLCIRQARAAAAELAGRPRAD